jgi:hypothetical protein
MAAPRTAIYYAISGVTVVVGMALAGWLIDGSRASAVVVASAALAGLAVGGGSQIALARLPSLRGPSSKVSSLLLGVATLVAMSLSREVLYVALQAALAAMAIYIALDARSVNGRTSYADK